MENWIVPIVLVAIAAVTAAGKLIFWMGEVNADRKGINEFMKEIRDDIKKILKRLPAATIKSSSPLQLTEMGRSISDDLDVRDWVQRIAPSLTERVKGKRPFEIQNFCFDYVKDEFEPSAAQLLRLQESAYDNSIDLDGVLDVLAIELRDRLLELAGASTPDSGEVASPAHL